jgi:hypothetical protein
MLIDETLWRDAQANQGYRALPLDSLALQLLWRLFFGYHAIPL